MINIRVAITRASNHETSHEMDEFRIHSSLHPTGRFGLNHEREDSITAQMYFTQRLLHQNQIFARSIPYLFMAHQYVERGR